MAMDQNNEFFAMNIESYDIKPRHIWRNFFDCKKIHLYMDIVKCQIQ